MFTWRISVKREMGNYSGMACKFKNLPTFFYSFGMLYELFHMYGLFGIFTAYYRLRYTAVSDTIPQVETM